MGKGSHLFWGFTKDFALRVEAPSCLGSFTHEDALSRGALLVQGEVGSYEEGNRVLFSWLVDKKGIVLDALFTAFGDPLLVGCAEIVCEKSVRRPYASALGITEEQLMTMAFGLTPVKSSQAKRLTALVLEARDRVCGSLCLPSCGGEEGVPHPEWDSLTQDEKLKIVRSTVEEYISPHLKRDGGGLDVLDFVEGNRERVVFQGACVECFASSGATLSYIQHVLRQRIHPSLIIEPILTCNSG